MEFICRNTYVTLEFAVYIQTLFNGTVFGVLNY